MTFYHASPLMLPKLIERFETAYKELEAPRSRELYHVLRRHALFVAARKKGMSTMDIKRHSGYDHATVLYASKNHESNLMLDQYRSSYRYYLKFLSLPEEQLKKELIKQQLKELQEQKERLNRELKTL